MNETRLLLSIHDMATHLADQDECEIDVLRTIETIQAENAGNAVRQALIVSRLDKQYTRKAIRTALWRLKSQAIIDVATPPNWMEIDGGAWWWSLFFSPVIVPESEQEQMMVESDPSAVDVDAPSIVQEVFSNPPCVQAKHVVNVVSTPCQSVSVNVEREVDAPGHRCSIS